MQPIHQIDHDTISIPDIQRQHLRLYRSIGLVMIVSVICKLFTPIFDDIIPHDLQGWSYSEFFINFSGGFVRRGLLGEILFHITMLTGIEPYYIIDLLCISAYFLVTRIFFRKFREGGYLWWIILSPLMCGYVLFLIRKDYLLALTMIGMLTLLKDGSSSGWKRIAVLILASSGILLHEAFIFWGVPMSALVMLTDRKHLLSNILIITAVLAVFTICCHFRGSISHSNSIVDCWNSVLDENPFSPIQNNNIGKDNNIGALSWDTKETMIFHIKKNIGNTQRFFGLIFWPILYMTVYYFITFFFNAFKPTRSVFGERERTVLSSLFLIATVCLLPMFLALSCDYARIFQYATMSAIAAYFILDKRIAERIIPSSINSKVGRLNRLLARLLPPSKGLLTMMLLLIGVSPTYYNPTASMIQSPIGSIGNAVINIMQSLVHSIVWE